MSRKRRARVITSSHDGAGALVALLEVLGAALRLRFVGAHNVALSVRQLDLQIVGVGPRVQLLEDEGEGRVVGGAGARAVDL